MTPTQENVTNEKASRRILVVDDNVDATESLSAYLELSGHQVEIVYDGPAAIAICQQHTFDAILLDIGLPGMDGYEVCRQIRKLNQTIFILAITGYSQDEDVARATEAGFNRHLTKPVDPRHLDEALLALRK